MLLREGIRGAATGRDTAVRLKNWELTRSTRKNRRRPDFLRCARYFKMNLFF